MHSRRRTLVRHGAHRTLDGSHHEVLLILGHVREHRQAHGSPGVVIGDRKLRRPIAVDREMMDRGIVNAGLNSPPGDGAAKRFAIELPVQDDDEQVVRRLEPRASGSEKGNPIDVDQ